MKKAIIVGNDDDDDDEYDEVSMPIYNLLMDVLGYGAWKKVLC